MYLLIYFRVTSLAQGQSYDCPCASEATLKEKGKIDLYELVTKHAKLLTMYIIPGLYSITHTSDIS